MTCSHEIPNAFRQTLAFSARVSDLVYGIITRVILRSEADKARDKARDKDRSGINSALKSKFPQSMRDVPSL